MRPYASILVGGCRDRPTPSSARKVASSLWRYSLSASLRLSSKLRVGGAAAEEASLQKSAPGVRYALKVEPTLSLNLC